jgi:hypothetical protein
MTLLFPSREFDDAVAAVCHGSASEAQARALNELLRECAAARDEYILRIELHSRLASNPDLFISAMPDAMESGTAACEIAAARAIGSAQPVRADRSRKVTWSLALAASFALFAAGLAGLRLWRPSEPTGTSSRAVAMLTHTVDAQWSQPGDIPRADAPLEPGRLRLTSGLAQIVFYSGVRVVIEGPAELELLSQNAIFCRFGRLTAEVPPQTRGFRVSTAPLSVTGLGTSMALQVTDNRTELHVFKGSVELETTANVARHRLQEGAGAVAESSGALRLTSAEPTTFASMFDLDAKSLLAETQGYEQWRAAGHRLDRDPSLLVHFDFANVGPSDWRLPNAAGGSAAMFDATIVGCQWINGRWPNKRALQFQSVNDRVRLSVPGEFAALTLAAWVRVQGLDRKLNSLFMCDGFEPGAVHWLIRHDGVLGLTVKGPGSGNFQILSSPPELTLDRFGLWVHLAVALDGNARRAIHYVNGRPVSDQALRFGPPYRIGAAELGNWNAGEFADDEDAFVIRNFSGAMDEFCLFGRALDAEEMHALYSAGKLKP